jgi:hypothetical protein
MPLYLRFCGVSLQGQLERSHQLLRAPFQSLHDGNGHPSADARVCGLYENLMASESWSGDCLSNDRATETASPSLEAERHIKSMSILNFRGDER